MIKWLILAVLVYAFWPTISDFLRLFEGKDDE